MTEPLPVPADLANPVPLAQALIRCRSITPHEGGALQLLEQALTSLGFTCHRLPFSEEGYDTVDNLYARLGDSAPHFCFAGHTDVVPVGDAAAWSVDPFGADIKNDTLFGRGAADMKGAIAAFVAAVRRLIDVSGRPKGSISLLITGDEEGVAVNGTRKMLTWLEARGETIDHCIVGEPTSPTQLGEMMKIGRRGSINGFLTVRGVQGHVAYPHLADNPLPRLIEMLRRLKEKPLDEGNEFFQPSNLEVTSIDVGNKTVNLIPAEGRAQINIRFNNLHTGRSLEDWMRSIFDAVVKEMGGSYTFETQVSGEAFLTEPGLLSDLIGKAALEVTGRQPELSTTGGTSDARFIKNYAPVVEFGLANQTMHKVDERVLLTDLAGLAEIYFKILTAYFAR